MKRMFSAMALVATLSLNVFSLEMIFRENRWYGDIEFLSRRGVIETNINNLPIRSDNLARDVEYALEKELFGKETLSALEKILLKRLLEKFSDKSLLLENKTSLKTILSHNLTDETTKSFCLSNRFYLKKDIPAGNIAMEIKTQAPFENTDSTKYRMDEWKSTGTDAGNTFLCFFGESWHVLGGRIKPSWGQGIKDDIFFSRKILPMDGIMAEVSWKNTMFSFFAANKSEYHHSDKRRTDNAYLSAHKISAELPFSSYIAFKEIVLYRSNLPQAYYLNPIMPYYIIQYNSHADDNIIWSIEAKNRHFKGFEISAELLIDDFQYEKTEEYTPQKTGLLLSASFYTQKLPEFVFLCEYAVLNTYTNTHQNRQLAYDYYGKSISYMNGTDMDYFVFGIGYKPSNSFKMDFDASLLREGEGTLDRSWESERPISKPDFPSGNAKNTVTSGICAEYKFMKKYRAVLGVTANFSKTARSGSYEKKASLTGEFSVTL